MIKVDVANKIVENSYVNYVKDISDTFIVDDKVIVIGNVAKNYRDSNEYAYGLMVFNTTTKETNSIFPDIDYELTSIDHLADGIYNVIGQQLSTQKSFVGIMDSTGNITITAIGDSSDPIIVELETLTEADFITIDGQSNDWDLGHATLSSDDDSSNLVRLSEVSDGKNKYALLEYNASDEMNVVVKFDNQNAVHLFGNRRWILVDEQNDALAGLIASIATNTETKISNFEFKIKGFESSAIEVLGYKNVEICNETASSNEFNNNLYNENGKQCAYTDDVDVINCSDEVCALIVDRM